ncbi:hypothetical protein L3X38_041452 [Prunus dulcis]|uniref:Uncharacterized protein n=1 Tax=Prunus dulcis TaxID=3755 RepID=A0AAD4YKM3_PRUDU|nr:hypothetical protein L3X38_041452 [Prunus dulcis]
MEAKGSSRGGGGGAKVVPHRSVGGAGPWRWERELPPLSPPLLHPSLLLFSSVFRDRRRMRLDIGSSPAFQYRISTTIFFAVFSCLE